MSEQLALSILAEAEQQQRVTLDRHRERVQAWFDSLPIVEKQLLAAMMAANEFDTCVALSAAAGDWRRAPCGLHGA